MQHLLMRDAISVLIESPIYWEHAPAERLDMVYYYIFQTQP